MGNAQPGRNSSSAKKMFKARNERRITFLQAPNTHGELYLIILPWREHKRRSSRQVQHGTTCTPKTKLSSVHTASRIQLLFTSHQRCQINRSTTRPLLDLLHRYCIDPIEETHLAVCCIRDNAINTYVNMDQQVVNNLEKKACKLYTSDVRRVTMWMIHSSLLHAYCDARHKSPFKRSECSPTECSKLSTFARHFPTREPPRCSHGLWTNK